MNLFIKSLAREDEREARSPNSCQTFTRLNARSAFGGLPAQILPKAKIEAGANYSYHLSCALRACFAENNCMNPKSIITLVIVLFAGVILVVLVWPKARAVGVLRGEILENRADALRIEQKLETTKKAISEFNNLSRADRDVVESALPNEADLPNLFVLMQSLIASSGLVGEDIKVIEIDRGLDIGFSLQGSYESFKQFLEEAEKSLRIFDVQTINFSGDTSKTQDTFRFGVKMKTWLY